MEKVYIHYLKCKSCYNPFENTYIIKKIKGKDTIVPKGNKNLEVCPFCRSALITDEKRTSRNLENGLPEGFSFDDFIVNVELPLQDKVLRKTEIRKEFLKCPVCAEKFVNDFEVREYNNPSTFSGGILRINQSHFQAVSIKPTKTCPDCEVYLVKDQAASKANKDILMTDEFLRELAGIEDKDGFFAKSDYENNDRNTKKEIEQAKKNRKNGLFSVSKNMLGKTIHDFCDSINMKLIEKGYNYSFVVNKDDQDVDFFGDRAKQENMALFNHDKTQKIVFYNDKKEGELYYLNIEKDIEYNIPYDTIINNMYISIEQVITDKFISMTRKTGRDERQFHGCTLPNNLINISGLFDKERDILRRYQDKLSFSSWSGNISENEKLYLIRNSGFNWK